MPVHIRLSPPADPIPVARGFYQPDDESLLVLVHYPGEQPRYFNHLDSESLRIETDIKGRLLSLELLIPQAEWKVDTNHRSSVTAIVAEEIRFLDFRTGLNPVELSTNRLRDSMSIRIERVVASERRILIAENLTATVASDLLLSLSVSGIALDRGGRAIRRWRKEVASATSDR